MVIGTEVQAMAEKDKLLVLTAEGKTIKAKIVRRELEPLQERSTGRGENQDLRDSRPATPVKGESL
jgi:hypothetical protein